MATAVAPQATPPQDYNLFRMHAANLAKIVKIIRFVTIVLLWDREDILSLKIDTITRFLFLLFSDKELRSFGSYPKIVLHFAWNSLRHLYSSIHSFIHSWNNERMNEWMKEWMNYEVRIFMHACGMLQINTHACQASVGTLATERMEPCGRKGAAVHPPTSMANTWESTDFSWRACLWPVKAACCGSRSNRTRSWLCVRIRIRPHSELIVC